MNGTYDNSTSTFTNLISDIKEFADGFLAVNAKYTPSNGSLSEQFGRTDGTPLSATDLTWSYASTLTAFGARNGTIPASWGAANLTVPKTCLTNYGPTSNVTFSLNATTVMGGSFLSSSSRQKIFRRLNKLSEQNLSISLDPSRNYRIGRLIPLY